MVRDTYLACEAYEDGEHVGVSSGQYAFLCHLNAV